MNDLAARLHADIWKIGAAADTILGNPIGTAHDGTFWWHNPDTECIETLMYLRHDAAEFLSTVLNEFKIAA